MTHTTATALTTASRAPQRPAAPRLPAARRPRLPATWLLALLLAGLASSVSAQVAVQFSLPPADSMVVAGHAVAFRVQDNIVPSSGPYSYQWYRNGEAISGATAQYYHFTAVDGDQGARYHVVAEGYSKPFGGQPAQHLGPTASNQATLTVLAAGASLPPEVTAPTGEILGHSATSSYIPFKARGNDLQWSYRWSTEPADEWHVLGAEWNGTQAVFLDNGGPPGHYTLTVRVIDDAGTSAVRTWTMNTPPGYPPMNVTATPNPVLWPNPTTLTCSAAPSDPDGDALTYTWGLQTSPGAATFEPNGVVNGTSSAATFERHGEYSVTVTVSDGYGGSQKGGYLRVTVQPNFDVRADLNGDGVVNAFDLQIVLDNFGRP